MRFLFLAIIALVLIGCGKKESSSRSVSYPCSGSKLIGKWSLDQNGSYGLINEQCTYIEYSADYDQYYTGTVKDHNLGSTTGKFTINYTDSVMESVGPVTIKYSIVNNILVYEFE
jgi:hypothetical protein